MSRQHAKDAALLVETLRIRPAWSVDVLRSEWSTAGAANIVQLALREGAAVWLSRRLAALDIQLEKSARATLSTAVASAAAHCMRIDAAFDETLAWLDGAGVECIPLKGVAMRAIARRIPYADARAPGDVDILCRSENAERAWAALRDAGYTSPTAAPEDAHHLPALVGRHGVGVDIHVTTVPAVTPDEAWRRATRGMSSVPIGGKARVIPSETELLWHALSHSLATIDIVAYTSLRLRHWLDAAALIASEVPIDWGRILGRLAAAESTYPLLGRAWLRVAFELSGREVPPDFQSTVPRLDLERLLAWRMPLAATTRTRWHTKLLEEGTRGEAGLPLAIVGSDRHLLVRARHRIASGAARSYWQLSVR